MAAYVYWEGCKSGERSMMKGKQGLDHGKFFSTILKSLNLSQRLWLTVSFLKQGNKNPIC